MNNIKQIIMEEINYEFIAAVISFQNQVNDKLFIISSVVPQYLSPPRQHTYSSPPPWPAHRCPTLLSAYSHQQMSSPNASTSPRTRPYMIRFRYSPPPSHQTGPA
ncbi:hypothetical protein FGO68_gene10742 [Halteria grandinella]|uniref:Uncharacterized protein n=1 Tax=Halteria grandinella TaxID=5974 RepID=A0A8J8P1H0_HALGN|nr:hypothetical protein FGO68_gene10742 [Halteria grandinella]